MNCKKLTRMLKSRRKTRNWHKSVKELEDMVTPHCKILKDFQSEAQSLENTVKSCCERK